jgi:hypothetical protein
LFHRYWRAGTAVIDHPNGQKWIRERNCGMKIDAHTTLRTLINDLGSENIDPNRALTGKANTLYGGSMGAFRGTARTAVEQVRTVLRNQFGEELYGQVFKNLLDSKTEIRFSDLLALDAAAKPLYAAAAPRAQARDIFRPAAEKSGLNDAAWPAQDREAVLAHVERRLVELRASDWPQARREAVSARLQEAFTQIGPKATAQDVVRAVDIVTFTESCFDRSTKYTEPSKIRFHQSMREAFMAGGAHPLMSLALIDKLTRPNVALHNAPEPKALRAAADREMLRAMPPLEQCEEMDRFIRAVVSPALAGKSALDGLMRNNPQFGQPGFASYEQIKHAGEPYFGAAVASIARNLQGTGFDFEDRSATSTLSTEEQSRIATQTRKAVPLLMDELVGGKAPADIEKAAAKLPQAYCDLLRTAHRAADEEIAKAGGVAPKTGEKIHQVIDSNLFGLRVVNPMLTADATIEDKELRKKMMNFSRIVQAANGGVSLTDGRARVLHPAIAEELEGEVLAYGPAIRHFMTVATMRGRDAQGEAAPSPQIDEQPGATEAASQIDEQPGAPEAVSQNVAAVSAPAAQPPLAPPAVRLHDPRADDAGALSSVPAGIVRTRIARFETPAASDPLRNAAAPQIFETSTSAPGAIERARAGAVDHGVV